MKSLWIVLAGLTFCVGPNLVMATVAAPAWAQAARHWRRGDVLPPEVLRSGPTVDYAAQRLRRPPDGYGWFTLNGAFLLASLSTGLVLEVVDN